MRELEATRAVVADLEALSGSSTVGTVESPEVAAVFERHTEALPPESQVLKQFNDLARRLREGPARTRVEGIRQIAQKLHRRAEDFGRQVEARDARLRDKG